MTQFLTDIGAIASEGISFFPGLSVSNIPPVVNPPTFAYAGDISATVNFNPLVVGLLGNYLDMELPLGASINEDFQGCFSVPPDLLSTIVNDISDGEITIDVPTILDVLDITDAIPTIPTIGLFENLFDVELAGSGTLTSVTGTTDFTFSGDQDAVVIDVLNPIAVAGSLIGEATTSAQGDFTVDLVLSEFVNVMDVLDIDLPSDVLFFITLAQMAGIDELELASGSFDLNVTTVPVTDPISTAMSESLFPVSVPM